jgi:tripartite-type tricarboxylate transporter receptor subunit TctC
MPIERTDSRGRVLESRTHGGQLMKLPRRKVMRLTAGVAALPIVSQFAWALDYPTRPVHMIVGLAAGGPTDVVARIVAQHLSEQMGEQFPVENRTGAGGSLATQAVINAPPDGYTLLFGGPTVTIGASLYRKLSNVLEELAPISGVMRFPNLMVVTPSLPVSTVAEFIDYAKAHPGELSMASSGVGASPHLTGEYFKYMTKIDIVHVPYRGSAAAYPDLISGKVHVLFDNLGGPVLQLVRSGKLRALAVTTAKRWPLVPDIPAIAETVPGYEINVWYGILAPRETPSEIVTILSTAVNKVLADPKVVGRFAEDGGIPMTMSPSELAKFLVDDRAKWHDIAQFAGIKAE